LSPAPFSSWERSVAGRYLRTKRKNGGVALISIISFVGIMLAVAVLIIVMSVMNGFRQELLSRMLGFNGDAYVQGPMLVGPERDAAVARVKTVPGVVQAMPVIEAQTMMIGPSQISGAIIRGVSAADLKSISLVANGIKRGSLDGFGEGEYGGDLVVLGEGLAQTLGVKPGDPVTLVSPSGASTALGSSTRQKDYTVAAVFNVGMSQYDNAFAYMPFQQAQLFFGRDDAADFIEAKLTDSDLAKGLKPKLAEVAGRGAIVTDWTDKNQAFFTALQVEHNVMRLILFMIVAIAAMNIISGLVMLVKNKGRDIAILRTMGAGQASILRIFIMAGGAVGVLGTPARLVFGVLFCTHIAAIQQLVEWGSGTSVVGGILFFALLMSSLAALGPAWRASRIDPVEALRYE